MSNLAFQLLAAANYIDALGGDSRSYRAAIASAPTKQELENAEDAERWRAFLSTRPANTHAAINQAIDEALRGIGAAQKGKP